MHALPSHSYTILTKDQKLVRWGARPLISTFPMQMHGGWGWLYVMDNAVCLEVVRKARQIERKKPIIVGCKPRLEMEVEGLQQDNDGFV